MADTTPSPIEVDSLGGYENEKLDNFEGDIRVIATRLWRMFVNLEDVFKIKETIVKRNAETERTDGCTKTMTAVYDVDEHVRQAEASNWKDYGISPSRVPSERYDGPSKDCLWDGVGRQLVPKGLIGRRNDEDDEKEPDEEERGGDPDRGRDPGDGYNSHVKQGETNMKLKPPAMLTPPRPSLDSISNIAPTPQFSKLQRLEHGQLEYFPIYENGFRQQPLRTEHHPWPNKVELTYQDRPIISSQEVQEHISQFPEALLLRERWLKKQKWRRLLKSLIGYRTNNTLSSW